MPYVSIEDLSAKIHQDLEEIREGKEGIRQKISIIEGPPEVLTSTPESISISFNGNYRALTDFNSSAYVSTLNMIKEGNNRVSGFMNMLLEDSLRTLEMEQPTEQVAVSYPFNDLTFIHYINPRVTIKYADMLDSFMKPAPAKLTKRSTIGDFHKLRIMMNEEGKNVLREKGLIDDKFIEDYKPQVQDNFMFVNLEGTMHRLDFYQKLYSSEPKLGQGIVVLLEE